MQNKHTAALYRRKSYKKTTVVKEKFLNKRRMIRYNQNSLGEGCLSCWYSVDCVFGTAFALL